MRKVTLKAMALAVLLATNLFSQCHDSAQGAYLNAGTKVVRLGNRFYEIGFHKSNGGIDYVMDKATGKYITEGNLNGCLWAIVFNYGPPADTIESCSYSPSGANRFSYAWSSSDNRLTLSYHPDPSAQEQVTATVTVTASEGKWFDMQIALENNGGRRSDGIKFPADLVFSRNDVTEALLPILPGVVLEPGFFSRGIRYETSYPGWPGVFADFMALSSRKGSLAMYALAEADRVVPVLLGYDFSHGADAGHVYALHDFKAHVPDGGAWTSPIIRMRISEAWNETIDHFRVDDGIDTVKSLPAKLGERYSAAVQSPLYKADTTALKIPFTDYPGLLAQIPYPGLLHVIGYEPLAADEGFPDFLPPAARYGTTQEMADMFSYAQSAGFLVMPYINPTWWEVGSPTLRHLEPPLTIADIAALDEQGMPYFESYGCPEDCHDGYIMSPYAAFVQERASRLVQQMKQELPSDIIYEDQIGARPTMFDYNPASPSPEAYTQGWVEHTRTHAGALLATECGFDRLTESVVGFHGSVLLLERLGETADWWGAGTWHYHPFVTFLARDKALFYTHNLAPESFTHDKATLAWNVALGYMLSYDLCPSHWGGGLDDEWIEVVGAFQRYVLAPYAGERITDYASLEEDVTQTSFESFSAITNWDERNAYTTGDYVLPPLGTLIKRNDDTLIAGVFTTYTGVPLSPGDHYLIEARQQDRIIIRQPMGADTSLTLRPLPGWTPSSRVEAVAFTKDGQQIGRTPLVVSNGGIAFTYQQRLADQSVAYYAVSIQP